MRSLKPCSTFTLKSADLDPFEDMALRCDGSHCFCCSLRTEQTFSRTVSHQTDMDDPQSKRQTNERIDGKDKTMERNVAYVRTERACRWNDCVSQYHFVQTDAPAID